MVQRHLFARQKRQGVGQPTVLLADETEGVDIGHVDGDETTAKVASIWSAYEIYNGGLGLGESDAARPGASWRVAWTLTAWVLSWDGYGCGPVRSV